MERGKLMDSFYTDLRLIPRYSACVEGNMIERQFGILMLILLVAGCGQSTEQTSAIPKNKPAITKHPIFYTNVTRRVQSRPAILVDLRDTSEDWFMTAELYLAVQSSRFPNETIVLMPLNVGDFAGCRKRFVQLPFEVEEGDTILFNLLDNDRLNAEQETLVVNGCKGCGYCIVVAGEIYCPGSAQITAPITSIASEILGQAILDDVQIHGFENFGTAEYIVPRYLPDSPNMANELDILNKSNYAPAALKIFGPQEEINFNYDET